ncbi:hypothetical protein [Falsiruegeria mediterranea]|uniref:Uncharacterized protein n=1 Tax=Falsiruegeria mediterranea M17 TaxID=1200281 RepID=A0A2R8C5F9_9RHOB|nr:hypothetical protein [Falsiruegeria mediterranea]SPJ27622.1 hypothetical protein TRM7615_01112 [Falsiruegeria mediterranea M17]
MWVEFGLHHSDFWDITIREYSLIIGARRKAKDAEVQAQRVLNQELGTLIQFAFHDPKNMPDFAKAGETGPRSKPMSNQEARAKLHAYFSSVAAQANSQLSNR